MSTFKEEQYYRKSFVYKNFTLTEVKFYTLTDTSIERCFNLSETTIEEIQKYRKLKVSGFILKIDGKLYFSEIPKDLKLLSVPIEGLNYKEHKCCSIKCICIHFSPNRCLKVKYGKYIELFPDITNGYESFNTTADSFVVLECKHFSY